jgi:hypothetical protein
MEDNPFQDYHNHISVTISYGPYCWCHNDNDTSICGYYLTKKALGHYMLNIVVQLDPNLSKITDTMEIMCNNEQLIRYKFTQKQQHYRLFFPISESHLGKSVQLNYYQSCNILRCFYTGKTVRMLHTDPFDIPQMNIQLPQECTICLENINPPDMYMTLCQHIFHVKCIWQYLETNHLTIPKSPMCVRLKCQHGSKVKSFRCPNCRNQLETLIII